MSEKVRATLLNAAIDDALRVLYNQYKYLKVDIDKSYDERLPDIEGNFANLGQVFINVIKNAIQALPEDSGKITLETRHQKDTGRGRIQRRHHHGSEQRQDL